ncbi:hypothetical protein LWI28_022603 [Acer negundo]|uniref:Eukaryotic translation initiation factor 4B3-like n=1 Tax=Acer negundo TaxID=4023 RepID=A0AAD5NVW4_ACENE|nr:hypothetical protein LWI28_022603 [Acer negundo]
MAATVSSPWSKPGAWALDAEEHEAELQQQEEKQKTSEIADFPSLAAAASTKTKKKKGQTLSLAEFNSGKKIQPNQPKGLTHEDLINLPTGPRERSAEELDRTRLGGGFKSYGSNSRYGSNGQNGDESSNSRWGSSRVSGRDGSSRELQPSRADGIDNWAAGKKPVSSLKEKGGFFESHSKADDSDSWVSNKTTESRSKFGFGGFERKSSFDSLSRDKERDRDNWGRKREESGLGGESEKPRPRLVLQPRTVPVSVPTPVTAPVSVPTPLSGDASDIPVAKPKASNPFGAARPREEVLAEKGKDWKEIDERLEAAKIKEDRPEAPERASSFGRRGFGDGNRGAVEIRSWRKSDSDTAEAATPQSAWKTENGNAWKTENGHVERKTENKDAEENSENVHVEEEN